MVRTLLLRTGFCFYPLNAIQIFIDFRRRLIFFVRRKERMKWLRLPMVCTDDDDDGDGVCAACAFKTRIN